MDGCFTNKRSCKCQYISAGDLTPTVAAESSVGGQRISVSKDERDVVSCAIKSDGTVQCWGKDAYGTLSVPADLGVVSSISFGRYHACAIKIDETVQ